jgi:hypothetical protein
MGMDGDWMEWIVVMILDWTSGNPCRTTEAKRFERIDTE